MQYFFYILFKVIKKMRYNLSKPFDWVFTLIVLYGNNCKFKNFKTSGIPKMDVARTGSLLIGNGFRMNNREWANPIGRFNRCSLIVGKGAVLKIGNNVGMSSTAIVCHSNIEIGDNVTIGGNVVIYDTDFHSLNAIDRKNPINDTRNRKVASVKIGNNAFIGAHVTVLKGVTIGENSIIGACSVVTKSIPKNEVWAGNPIRLIRKISG